MMRGGELMALDTVMLPRRSSIFTFLEKSHFNSTSMQRPLEQLETPFEGRFRVRHERLRSDAEQPQLQTLRPLLLLQANSLSLAGLLFLNAKSVTPFNIDNKTDAERSVILTRKYTCLFSSLYSINVWQNTFLIYTFRTIPACNRLVAIHQLYSLPVAEFQKSGTTHYS
ncbi:hypothetical protein YC2023_010880 [Brassica napus]